MTKVAHINPTFLRPFTIFTLMIVTKAKKAQLFFFRKIRQRSSTSALRYTLHLQTLWSLAPQHEHSLLSLNLCFNLYQPIASTRIFASSISQSLRPVTDCSRLFSPSHLLSISRCRSDNFFTSKLCREPFPNSPS